ncbi:MAG: hypothetical protein K2P78_09640 [Gemmataceae bacterium]|nr:hypothetical protein [Gemmataceae bacterium]
MSRSRKWAGRAAVWGTLVAVLSVGCSPLTMIAFLMHKDDKVPARCPLPPKDDEATGKKKDEVKVAVLCAFAQTPTIEFASTDRELAALIVKRFPDVLKESGSKSKITFVPAADVDKFKTSNPNWKAMHPSAWGKKLGADYVIEYTLSGLQLYQPGSRNEIYEGRAEVTIDVYDVDVPGGAPKHNYIHGYSYPKGMARDAGVMPATRFRNRPMISRA